MDPQSKKLLVEVEKLREANRQLKDELRLKDKINQRVEDMLRRTETRCNVYQRQLMARLGIEANDKR